MDKPNFLGIGAVKAGTTWVADQLAAHPDIFMAHGKELHYFSLHHDKEPDWYLEHFRSAKGQGAVGEYSVTYMDGSPETARRVHAFNPDFRLIVTLRDPVGRAFSQYRWLKQMGHRLPSFREALALRPDLIRQGCYAANLEPYWALFPAGQFHYIRQADIRGRPQQVRRELYAFLEVDAAFQPQRPERAVGETIQPRSRALEDLRIRLHKAAMRHGAGFAITLYRKLGLSRVYRRVNNDRQAEETLTAEDRQAIAPLFEEDLRQLREHTGISILP
jgi:hypothetical protein